MKKFLCQLDNKVIVIREGENAEEVTVNINKDRSMYSQNRIVLHTKEITQENKMECMEEMLVNIQWLTEEHSENCMWECAGLENVYPLMNKRIQLMLMNLEIPFSEFRKFAETLDEDKLMEKYKDYYTEEKRQFIFIFLHQIFEGMKIQYEVYLNGYDKARYSIWLKCKDCGEIFSIEPKQVQWFQNKGFEIPKRCEDCREKRRNK